MVNQFQTEAGPPFFILSLKAGGSGLNLTAASHVIHFDRWWNPAVENQATDRAFRIGQKNNVLVHKFVTTGTLEEKIDALLSEKQQKADQILEESAEKSLTEMSNDELLDLVKLDLEKATANL
jgi:non-specific serine/threonine protein kinase